MLISKEAALILEQAALILEQTAGAGKDFVFTVDGFHAKFAAAHFGESSVALQGFAVGDPLFGGEEGLFAVAVEGFVGIADVAHHEVVSPVFGLHHQLVAHRGAPIPTLTHATTPPSKDTLSLPP